MDRLAMNLGEVPVVDIHRDNLSTIWPSLLYALKSATFIAVDAELSGLGDRKALISKSVADRYKAISEAACSRSVISLGLSCFKNNSTSADKHENPTTDQDLWSFSVQTFNITLLCSEDYVVEPASLHFLVGHDFDFNKQYSLGVTYYRGNDRPNDTECRSVRQLFTELVRCKQRLIIHNGFVDLVFLYQNLYCDLPPTLQAFVADVSELFPGGVFDTKCLAEFKARVNASYLEYLFRKMQRLNQARAKDNHSYVMLEFPNYYKILDHIELRNLISELNITGTVDKTTICQSFANHGWCSKSHACPLSHDVEMILDLEVVSRPHKKRSRKKRLRGNKRRALEVQITIKSGDSDDDDDVQSPVDETSETVSCSDEPINLSALQLKYDMENIQCSLGTQGNEDNTPKITQPPERKPNTVSSQVSSTHRAGYDAFMTGYIMAVFLSTYCKIPSHNAKDLELDGLEDLINRVYLSRKDVPLIIQKSSFAKPSQDHKAKMLKINEENCQ